MREFAAIRPARPHWRLKYRADAASLRLCVAALKHLLEGHGWQANDAIISAVLPLRIGHYRSIDVLDALHRLRLPVHTVLVADADANALRYPCLLMRGDGAFGVVVGAHRDLGYQVIHPQTGIKTWVGSSADLGELVQIGDATDTQLLEKPATTLDTLSDLAPHLWPLFLASFLVNLLGLATPFLVMAIYNLAIPAKSGTFLVALAAGLALAYCAEWAIRSIRSKAIVHLAAGLESRLGLSLLHKLIKLPLAIALRSDALQQQARLRQFESMRDAMMGPLVQALLDIPFLVLFAGALFFISPTIGLIILAFAGVMAASFWVVGQLQRRRVIASADAQTVMRQMVLQTIDGQRAIRRANAGRIWAERLRSALDDASMAEAELEGFTSSTRFILQGLMTIAGLSAGFIAASQVMQGTLSLGGLIAVLILVWRIMVPIYTLSIMADQALSIFGASKTIDAVLSLPEERHHGIRPKLAAVVKGEIRFEQVTFRYPEAHAPAVAGVSFAARQGEVVILAGHNMSGKTTLIEVLAGLHDPLAGRITVDGDDTRQIPRDELRSAISLVLQEPRFLYGTIRQNLELAMPLLTEDACWKALERGGIAQWVETMPDHLETLLSADSVADLPLPLKRGINLSMAFARDCSIYTFDQPTAALDPRHAQHVRQEIERLKGVSTVLIATTNPDDLYLGDRFVVLDRGRVISNESGQRGLERTQAYLGQARARADA